VKPSVAEKVDEEIKVVKKAKSKKKQVIIVEESSSSDDEPQIIYKRKNLQLMVFKCHLQYEWKKLNANKNNSIIYKMKIERIFTREYWAIGANRQFNWEFKTQQIVKLNPSNKFRITLTNTWNNIGSPNSICIYNHSKKLVII
jgi:hypothetical protein